MRCEWTGRTVFIEFVEYALGKATIAGDAQDDLSRIGPDELVRRCFAVFVSCSYLLRAFCAACVMSCSSLSIPNADRLYDLFRSQ